MSPSENLNNPATLATPYFDMYITQVENVPKSIRGVRI